MSSMLLETAVTLQRPALPRLRARVPPLLWHHLRLIWLRRLLLLLLVLLRYVTTLDHNGFVSLECLSADTKFFQGTSSATGSTATSSTGAGSVIHQNIALAGAMGLFVWGLTA